MLRFYTIVSNHRLYFVNFWGWSKEYFYNNVQTVVDSVRAEDADYVVLCAHLGDEEGDDFNSYNLIANTSGVDVILDAHSHKVIEKKIIKNKENNDVIFSSAGSELKYIGRLTIAADGSISTRLISEVEEKDPVIDRFIANMESKMDYLLNKVAATSNNALSIYDGEGVRIELDPSSYYTVTSTDYLLLQGGGGYTMFDDGYIIYYHENVKDIDVLVKYLRILDGDISKYNDTENRINVK